MEGLPLSWNRFVGIPGIEPEIPHYQCDVITVSLYPIELGLPLAFLFYVGQVGLEPTFSISTLMVPNHAASQLAHNPVVWLQGIEPYPLASEATMLPLHLSQMLFNYIAGRAGVEPARIGLEPIMLP